MPEIPIFIISFNQATYLRNTLLQLKRLQVPNREVHVVDNASDYPPLIEYLKRLELEGYKIHFMKKNLGHKVIFSEESGIELPEFFAVTDPDLQFHEEMPVSFREDFLKIAQAAKVTKCGCALRIDEGERFKEGHYFQNHTIRQWERRYYESPVELQALLTQDGADFIHEELKQTDAYWASIDTTFAVYIKSRGSDKFLRAVRVSGKYRAKHLPWYDENHPANEALPWPTFLEREHYAKTQTCSTTSGMNSPMNQESYPIIQRQEDENAFVIDPATSNASWWSKHFVRGWEDDTFEIFRTFLHHPRGPARFLDIGSWIGTTALWAATQCEKVYCVEADPESVQELSLNVKANRFESVITLIPHAIYPKSDEEIAFGPGLEGKLNVSTSRILEENSALDGEVVVKVKSIDLETLAERYGVLEGCSNLFIKCDIEGGEEAVLASCLRFAEQHRDIVSALFVSFHLDWWKNASSLKSILDRFYDKTPGDGCWTCMTTSFKELKSTDEIEAYILAHPFESLLWFQTTDSTLIARLQYQRNALMKQTSKLKQQILKLGKEKNAIELKSQERERVATKLKEELNAKIACPVVQSPPSEPVSSSALENVQALKKCKELEKRVKALEKEKKATRKAIDRWNQRSWFTRAIHKLRIHKP